MASCEKSLRRSKELIKSQTWTSLSLKRTRYNSIMLCMSLILFLFLIMIIEFVQRQFFNQFCVTAKNWNMWEETYQWKFKLKTFKSAACLHFFQMKIPNIFKEIFIIPYIRLNSNIITRISFILISCDIKSQWLLIYN